MDRGRAFSLVEVVIAIAILSVGLVGSMRVFPMGLRASRRAEQVSRATLLAERAMASTKLTSWDELAFGTSTTTDGDYTITVTIDQPEVEAMIDPTHLKRVSVSIGWSQEGRDRTLDLVTYL
ncbi:MAG: type II secretion system protein, partial [Candidatus Omnitrophica bacterium]|nr:type II secretion system protein [Candidatus Omnitrophota bacterium]